MANLLKDIQCAGSDTRPPMLDRTDFASWQQRIHLYCRGTEGALHLGPERPRVYSDLSPEDKERYNADIRTTNILLQGLPKDIYTLINHYTDAKDIWNNVKMLLEVVKLNRGLRDSNYDQLYAYLKQHDAHANENKMMLDQFTQHTVDPLALMYNVSYQQYYPQSSTAPPSTYVPPHFADNTRLDSGLSPSENLIENLTNTLGLLTQSYKTGLRDSNYDQLYAYLKQHDAHANENKMMLDRFTQHTVDPLALMYNFKTAGLLSRMFKVDRIEDRGTMHKVHVQLVMEEHRTELGMLIQVKQDKMLLMQAQENGVALDEKQLFFITGGQDNAIDEDMDEQPVQDLALNVDNMFQADDCDAFDSDVDEAPTAQTMFMA
ncbi:hypothetical protein Tco_1477803, partial [Tanacetum coccineum]